MVGEVEVMDDERWKVEGGLMMLSGGGKGEARGIQGIDGRSPCVVCMCLWWHLVGWSWVMPSLATLGHPATPG